LLLLQSRQLSLRSVEPTPCCLRLIVPQVAECDEEFAYYHQDDRRDTDHGQRAAVQADADAA
jgi:hypothetical protein